MSKIVETLPAASNANRPSRFAGATDRPVFIGACPRSGTTLLRSMLNSHPDLAIPRESRFVLETWRRRDRWGDLADKDNRRRLAKWIFKRKAARPARLETGTKEGIARLVAAPPTLGSLVGTCLALYAERYGKSRWGDKRPMYCQYLDATFAMFPDAQFINIVRDPRATAASMRKIGWYEGDIGPATELWDRSMRAVQYWRKRLTADQYMDLHYEELVSDPAGTMARICAFLNLDPAGIDRMLAHVEGADLPTSTIHWQVAQPVTTASVRSWEQTLSSEEVAFIELVTATEMRRHGYEPVTAGASASAVPAELRRVFDERHRHHAGKRRARKRYDAKLRFIYRKPVAARLTSGQRAGRH